jgi:hypothetical protein
MLLEVDEINDLDEEKEAFFKIIKKLWISSSDGVIIVIFEFLVLSLVNNQKIILSNCPVEKLYNCLKNFNHTMAVKAVLGILLHLSLDDDKTCFISKDFWNALTIVLGKSGLNICWVIMLW